jgi:histidyl-tRNA synthetase
MDYAGRGLKSQMKQGDRLGAAWTLIVGDDELHNNQALLRDMRGKEQRAIALDAAAIYEAVGGLKRLAGIARGTDKNDYRDREDRY